MAAEFLFEQYSNTLNCVVKYTSTLHNVPGRCQLFAKAGVFYSTVGLRMKQTGRRDGERLNGRELHASLRQRKRMAAVVDVRGSGVRLLA
jgi:hypothetical protein